MNLKWALTVFTLGMLSLVTRGGTVSFMFSILTFTVIGFGWGRVYEVTRGSDGRQ